MDCDVTYQRHKKVVKNTNRINCFISFLLNTHKSRALNVTELIALKTGNRRTFLGVCDDNI